MTALLEELEHHIHSVQKVAPTGAPPITVSAGAIWTLGVFSNDILAGDAVPYRFDTHWAVISDPSANAHYELVLYYGAEDIECARISFTRTGPFVASVSVPVVTPILPKGSRLRAKLMGSVADITADIRVFYHIYD